MMKSGESIPQKRGIFIKHMLFTFAFIGSMLNGVSAQVTSVQYLIEYNDISSLYDCKIVIESGSAITYPQRIQFNTQYTVLVPAEADCILSEFHNPLEDNQFYTGTQPLVWKEQAHVLSPDVQPENDFYAFIPDFNLIASYDNLYTGDTVTLFSLQINVDPCENGVRPFQNNIDLYNDGWITGAGDYSNGFTLGGIAQIYSGNLESSYGVINYLDPIELCIGSTSSIFPVSNGIWQSDHPEIIQVDEQTGTLTALSDGITHITFTDHQTGCISEFEATVFSEVETQFQDENTICIGHFTTVSPPGTWISNDPTIATIDIQGNVQGHAEGNTLLIYTDSQTGCISSPLQIQVVPQNDPNCVVGTTEIEPTQIKIYPNPAEHTIYIDSEKSIESISIYTLDFHLMKYKQITGNEKNTLLSVENMFPGAYLLKIQTGEIVNYKRIFITK
ncbi:MAG: T9SS type A sorting domain-containing protein [Saprospiraceae bacterium]|nr:T9SS type A sorting domain-containing protein [Saprospiraceae bacterium]